MSDTLHPDEHSNQHQPSRNKRFCGCLAIFAISLLAVFWFGGIFSHDWNLWQLDRSFRSIKHPAGTKSVVHHKEVGLLIGNGNHCDYFTGDLRTYSCTKQEIGRFYQQITVRNPISGRKEGLGIAFIENGEVKGYHYPDIKTPYLDIETPYVIEVMARSLKQGHDKNNYYVVYMLDAGYDVGLDLRCI